MTKSQIDILDEETQQRRGARSEGDERDTGNTAPHKQDDAEGFVNACPTRTKRQQCL